MNKTKHTSQKETIAPQDKGDFTDYSKYLLKQIDFNSAVLYAVALLQYHVSGDVFATLGMLILLINLFLDVLASHSRMITGKFKRFQRPLLKTTFWLFFLCLVASFISSIITK